MRDDEWLAQRFEENRARMRAVAYRMLGSAAEADDAVQEAWLRLSRTDTSDLHNLGGWLTTVVSRVALDMLRSRTSRREDPLDDGDRGAATVDAAAPDPEGEAMLADAVGPALLVVLDSLAPAERLAFVLHDLFAMPFDEIAVILERTPAATRQLASRARRRVQGARTASPDPVRQRLVVDAFLAASRNGQFDDLLALLDPEVVLQADQRAVENAAAARAQGAPPLERLIHGAAAVAGTFSGRAQGARPALVDGVPAAAVGVGGALRAVFRFTFDGDHITAIEIVGEPDRLAAMDVTVLR
ncbi:sigma-70 family RNA polymerase sigma factor [Jiangella rhizosphaerae]|uniref:Sigma-70 family RNA polymerase sigma factor n=1 Tax=Jiangella rhizosphaerae TaxID=2293569 RepID=A0A418KR78_9ACTN|nr:sigma-70 family RNA polymerase sigma factor [Jiangella rhizosphaerae]RIQ23207.1 sigma-70 family RNA polymerase sigma factor [Jiangella rhizosphaerae]